MTQCPDHLHVLGATLGQCTACQRESGAVDPERARELARLAKNQIPRRQVTHRHPTPTPDTERTNAIRDQIDQEAQS